LLQEQKKTEFENKKKQIQAEREAKKNGTTVPILSETVNTAAAVEDSARKQSVDDAKKRQAEAKAKILEERKKIIEDRKIDVEERKRKTLEARDAKINGTVSDTVVKQDTLATPIIVDSKKEAIEKQAATKAQTLEERKKILEDRKRAIEERRKKILEEREAAKNAKEKI
jgi:hypothetical protein